MLQSVGSQGVDTTEQQQHASKNTWPSFVYLGIKAWRCVIDILYSNYWITRASLIAQLVKNPPAVQESENESCSVMSNPATPWAAAHQAFLSFTVSQSFLKLMSIESMMQSNHLILCCPLLFLPSIFPSIRVFSRSQLFASGGQRIGASTSASVLLMNIQGWFLLGLTGLISLLSKGLSRVFSSTTVWKHQFSGNQPFYCAALTSAHDYWKNHSFDYTDLCWQRNVSAL